MTAANASTPLVAVATDSDGAIGGVGGFVNRVSANFTRPADTTAYASGDLVANNTAAGSVVPMSFAVARSTGKGGVIRRGGLKKSTSATTNASFRLHLYAALPAPSNGDNGAWLTDQVQNYLGSFDFTIDKAFTDGGSAHSVPNVGNEIVFTTDTVYGLLEARAAYAPGNQEVFTVKLEVFPN